jgi:hypothetical protein
VEQEIGVRVHFAVSKCLHGMVSRNEGRDVAAVAADLAKDVLSAPARF